MRKDKDELTWSIVIVNSNGQVPRHVSDRIPTFQGKVDARLLGVQLHIEKKLAHTFNNDFH
jgi:hypothetical protein